MTARCADFLLAKPGYKMGRGPLSEAQLAQPWHWPLTDCSSAATWLVGVAKHEDGVWWGTGNIYADARGKNRRWRCLLDPLHPGSPRAEAPVGCIVVYPGHCGVVTGGTLSRPETVESASSKHGAWRGFRPRGFWQRKNAVFVVPVEV